MQAVGFADGRGNAAWNRPCGYSIKNLRHPALFFIAQLVRTPA